ncbi:diacylglycerol/lipid kinase family protein [Rhodomicrobium lacus]|uniref:diacylglycerol/lipid kinase family protein n=1 Tax=Rhodomicrobium lacus TaxID=2498452 RepID=UPI0026E3CA4C|nr:diacylglycerol kinase family protein [Rhodomicrobium lacus]WKW51885.1 diacylglycerol kinase family protein [Rhodomicrobium lacus]
MRVHAVINSRAGQALGVSGEDLAREARAAFEAVGHTITLDLVEPAMLSAALDRAAAEKPDVLLAGGGDGTVTSAARRLLGSKTALAILPLGTVNRLARDLGIPLAPDAALGALASGEFRKIDVAEVNGEAFLCNSLLGLPPKISAGRQALRGRPLGERIRGYFALLKTVIASRGHLDIAIDGAETERKRVRVFSLAVSNNLYDEKPGLVFSRKGLSDGKLGVYIAKPYSGLGLIWVLARASLGLWRGDDRLERLSASEVTIMTRRKKTLRLSNDGEVVRMRTPLKYRVRPAALTVLVPVSEDAR